VGRQFCPGDEPSFPANFKKRKKKKERKNNKKKLIEVARRTKMRVSLQGKAIKAALVGGALLCMVVTLSTFMSASR
jgi:hypothetical protein